MSALTIARFTVQEAISRRLVLAGVLVSLAFVALFAVGFAFLYGEALKQAPFRPAGGGSLVVFAGAALTVLGLYTVYFLSSFLALFLSVGAISGEIDSGLLHAVLARPLRRGEFVLGRWLGFAALLTAYVGAMAGVLLALARLIAGYEAPDSGRTIALMLLGALVLLTMSLLGSTLLSTLANGVVGFSLFGVAWLAGFIEYLGGVLANDGMVNLGTAVSLLLPSDAIWRSASYYVQSPAYLAMASSGPTLPFASAAPPAAPLIVWALGYLLLGLAGAVAAFSRRDL
jgi:ABC-type transport system involved in multi-copper enzyme maturation permease subunit